MALLALYFAKVQVFVLVLTRISGLIMTAPIYGSRQIPLRVRAMLAIALALVITPFLDPPPSAPSWSSLMMAYLLAREALLGMAIGLAVMILFTGLQVTGQVVGQMSGMALADVVDPSFDLNIPIFSQLFDVILLSVFLLIGGHRQVLQALLDTFAQRPVGAADLPVAFSHLLGQLLSESFIIGFRAAAPVMVALLMSILIMGLISRTLPQLNILAFGFSLNTVITLGVLALCLGAMISVVLTRADVVLETVQRAIAGPS